MYLSSLGSHTSKIFRFDMYTKTWFCIHIIEKDIQYLSFVYIFKQDEHKIPIFDFSTTG